MKKMSKIVVKKAKTENTKINRKIIRCEIDKFNFVFNNIFLRLLL